MIRGLTPTEKQLLAKLSREDRNASNKRPTPKRFTRARPALSMGIKFIRAPSGGIPARAANLLGKATCDVFWLHGATQTISDSGNDIEVLNWGVTAACATGDRYGIAGYYNGAWWIISEDCADTGTSGVMSLTGGSPTEGDGDTGLSDDGDSGMLLMSGQEPTTGDMATWGTPGEAPPLLP